MSRLVNYLVAVAIFGVAWYGYTHWVESAADPDVESQSAGYNCRGALARLAQDYRCREDANCTLNDQELTAMREREAEIEEHCN